MTTGAPRKRRLRRVASATVDALSKFSPSADDFKRYENVLSTAFSLEDQAVLVRIVNTYYLMGPLERAAPFQADVSAYLEYLNATAVSLIKPPRCSKAAVDHAHRLIAMQYRKSHRDFDPHEIISSNSQLHAATTAAISNLNSENVFAEGDAWCDFIRSLTELCQSSGWPFGVSHSTPEKSRFLRFLRELYATFPPVLRRHDLTDDGLAKAVGKAQRQRRPLPAVTGSYTCAAPSLG